ncbi:MAG: HAMP domain-containing histidine kinase [Salinibacterium sp.]|nr:HAMP domain-containing histidine kinase [Salinibacterium sp.]
MLAVAAVGMIVAGATAYVIQRARSLAEIDDRLRASVDESSFIAEDAQAANLDDVLYAIVQRLRPGTHEATFALVGGRTAIVPGGLGDVHPEQDPEFVARVLKETGTGQVVRGTAAADGTMVRYVAIPVTVEGDATGIFVVTVDLNARLLPVDEAFRTFAIVAAGALVALGLVGWVVAGRLLSPIRKLRETAARITATDVSERIEVVGSDDVSELTVTVNGMLDRLDSALTGQRQLLDDVGHELKTPITIVRGHLEVMQASDEADVMATRALAIDELDRMGGLVRDISDLAAVLRPLRIRREPIDVRVLTQSVRTKASALSTEHEWVSPRMAQVTAQIDPERLTQALLQLAANAVTHGSATGTIEICSEVRAGRLLFTVHDDGPGIDPRVADTIFERFHRGSDADGSEGRGVSGSGLGLAIVAAIAEAHGGTASVATDNGAGSTFVIDIPLDDPPRLGAVR